MLDADGYVFTLVVDRNGIFVNTFMAIAPRAVCVHDVRLLFSCQLFISDGADKSAWPYALPSDGIV